MNLLKAARGGVIRDLTVDWGLHDSVIKEEPTNTAQAVDDFELVPEDPEKAEAEPKPKPAINLFDELATDQNTEETPIGPSEVKIILPPPPRIQQAPLIDKLPIPLYPGFRTSIFAIIKHDNASTPSTITISGNVLGHAVTLTLPVVVVVPPKNEGGDGDESGRILHVLASRALIQDWEDQTQSPERNAQIVRLGTTYSLASSQTSFIAVDDTLPDQVEDAPNSSRRTEIDAKRKRLASLRSQRAARTPSTTETLDVEFVSTMADMVVDSLDVASVQAQFSGFSYDPGSSPSGAMIPCYFSRTTDTKLAPRPASARPKKAKMALSDFLDESTYGSWADEMDDLPSVPASGRGEYIDLHDAVGSSLNIRCSIFPVLFPRR